MKKSSILALITIAISIAIIISSYADSSTYGSISEAKETKEQLHIVGYLDKNKEMYYNPVIDANYFSFFLKDEKGEVCKVVFTGAKPQDFERSEKIVLVGKMNGNIFHANHITLKCPSKYTNDKVEFKEVSNKTNI